MRFGMWKGQRLSRTCNEQIAMSQKSGSQNHCDETCKTQKSSISWYLLCLPNSEQSILLACFEVLLYDNYTEHLHLARVDRLRQISFNRTGVQTSPQYILCLAQNNCKSNISQWFSPAVVDCHAWPNLVAHGLKVISLQYPPQRSIVNR